MPSVPLPAPRSAAVDRLLAECGAQAQPPATSEPAPFDGRADALADDTFPDAWVTAGEAANRIVERLHPHLRTTAGPSRLERACAAVVYLAAGLGLLVVALAAVNFALWGLEVVRHG